MSAAGESCCCRRRRCGMLLQRCGCARSSCEAVVKECNCSREHGVVLFAPRQGYWLHYTCFGCVQASKECAAATSTCARLTRLGGEN